VRRDDQGRCEVVPDKPCIWVAVYDRAKAAEALDGLKTYVPPPIAGCATPARDQLLPRS